LVNTIVIFDKTSLRRNLKETKISARNTERHRSCGGTVADSSPLDANCPRDLNISTIMPFMIITRASQNLAVRTAGVVIPVKAPIAPVIQPTSAVMRIVAEMAGAVESSNTPSIKKIKQIQ
jgi:hypothetical protein